MPKSSQAFRTISEVAEDLDIQKHVLRFWESKFAQLRPMKRGGGRRYYRPEDVELLRGIHHLLRSQAYTIKGVQRILREQGAEFVKACWTGGRSIPDAVAAQAEGVGGRGRRSARGTGTGAGAAPPTGAGATRALRGSGGSGGIGIRGKGRAGEEVAGVNEAIGHLEEARQTLSGTRRLSEADQAVRGSDKVRKAGSADKGPAAKVAAKVAPKVGVAKRGTRVAAARATKRG